MSTSDPPSGPEGPDYGDYMRREYEDELTPASFSAASPYILAHAVKTQRNHEKRLRMLERESDRRRGALALLKLFVALIGAAVISLAGYVVAKVIEHEAILKIR